MAETVRCDCDSPCSHDLEHCSWWVCPCGNNPGQSGLFACDPDGTYREPDDGWKGHYRCDDCGRVFNRQGVMTGQIPDEMRADYDNGYCGTEV